MFFLTLVSLVLNTLLAFEFHALQAVINLPLLPMEATIRRTIVRTDRHLHMTFLLGTAMQFLIAFPTVHFAILWAVVQSLGILAVLAYDIIFVPLRQGGHAFPDEVYLVLQAALGFVLHSVLVRVYVELQLVLRYVDGVDAPGELRYVL